MKSKGCIQDRTALSTSSAINCPYFLRSSLDLALLAPVCLLPVVDHALLCEGFLMMAYASTAARRSFSSSALHAVTPGAF